MGVDRHLSLTKLDILEAVVTQGGITRAADHLGVSQPVVTAHVRALERQVGAELLVRRGRRVELTEAGRVVYSWARDVLRRTRELDRDLVGVDDGKEGKLALATSMSIGSYLLPPLFSDFLGKRPGVELKVDIIDAAHAIAAVEEGEDDLCVVVIEAPPPNPSLYAERLGTEGLLVVAPASRDPSLDPTTVEELSDLPFVEAQGGSLRRSFIEGQLRRAGLGERRVAIELGHPEAMKQVVMAGLGVACLFRSAVRRELADGTLRELRIPGLDLEGPVFLIHRRDKILSAAQRALIEALRSFFTSPVPPRKPGLSLITFTS